MAGKKISQLNTAPAALLTDYLAAEQGTQTYKESLQQILDLFSEHISSITYQNVTDNVITTEPNNGYVTNSANTLIVNYTLPLTATIGTIIDIVGSSEGGWKINQLAGQTIRQGILSSMTGTAGSVSSTNRYDRITLVCIVENLEWNATPSGNPDIV